MAEWVCEHGVGETRVALVEDGRIVEAHVMRRDHRPALNAIVAVRILSRAPNGRVMAEVPRPPYCKVLVTGVPGSFDVGTKLKVRITREPIPERGRLRPAHGEAVDDSREESGGISFVSRFEGTGVPLRFVPNHGPDLIEEAGWSALIEEARTGEIMFEGGRLLLFLTPAMTLIDVDGTLPPLALGKAAADAAAAAIRRHGIGGSIGIDFPTIAAKPDRQAIAAIIDATLPPPFERTAVNGFGFMQIIRRRERPSLPELVQGDPTRSKAIELARRAARTPGAGQRTLVCHPAVAQLLSSEAMLDGLRTMTGVPHVTKHDVLAPWEGRVDAEYP